MQRTPTHHELYLARNNPDQTDPLARAVTSALKEYARQINEYTVFTGTFPKTVTLAAPRNAIETFALEDITIVATQLGMTIVTRIVVGL